MKIYFAKHGLLLSMVLLALSGCNSSSKSKKEKEKTTTEVASFDAMKIKDQIVETIGEIPSEKEVVTLLNESGAAFIYDLTVPADQVEKLMTKSDQSFGLGLYSFDLLYASIYNRGDLVSQISDNTEKLIEKLGLREELISSKNYMERIKANEDNVDSLDYLVSQNLQNFHEQMSKGTQPDVYALSLIGSNVEALYILSQSTLLAQDNTKLLEIMNQQEDRVKMVFKLLEIMSADEDVKPYYEQFKPVAKIFEENPTITEKELAEIESTMGKVRQSILN